MITISKLSNAYFDWLCEQVDIQDNYSKLARFLFDEEFTWIISNDCNRASDGLSLRNQFAKHCDIPTKELDAEIGRPCSVLEMMVALSNRIEYAITETEEGPMKWFWIMMHNIGVENYINEKFNPEEVNEKIKKFLDRKYFKDGRGGLFYIKGTKEDMTKAEIWYQCCWFLDSYIL